MFDVLGVILALYTGYAVVSGEVLAKSRTSGPARCRARIPRAISGS